MPSPIGLWAAIATTGALLVLPPSVPAGASTTLAQSGSAVVDCGVNDLNDEVAPGTPLLYPAASKIVTGQAVSDFAITADSIYVLSAGQKFINRYTLSGNLLGTINLNWIPSDNLAVDDSGNVYVARQPYDVVKLDAAGNIVWSRSLVAPIRNLVGHNSPAGWLIGGVTADTTYFFNPNGGAVGHVPLAGQRFTETADSGLVATNGRYVYDYDASYSKLFSFGAQQTQNDPMPEGAPLHFYQQGAATRLTDGRYLVADATKGIYLVSPRGAVEGLVPDSDLGALTQNSEMQIVGTSLYFSAGGRFNYNQTVSRVALSDLLAYATQPKPLDHRLGFGAGVSTGAPGNYYEPGTSPHLTLSLDDWWKQVPELSVAYTVRRADQVEAHVHPTPVTVSVGSDDIAAGFHLQLPAPAPGAYEADVRLLSAGQPIGATCVHYGVGATGDGLSMSSLPGGADAGGPDGARGVALADIMGLGGHRIAFDWRRLLDASGRTTFSYYDPIVAAALTQSQARGVPFSVQLGSGGPESVFVQNGTWGQRVAEVVQHYAGKVHYWEAWNEPNITGFQPSDYVNKILKPAYAAVKAADPTAKVIGGTVVGMGNYPYWQGIADAGGFSYMDIAGIHPYPGHNRSWEEEGFTNRLQIIRTIAASAGKPNIPVWITEFAWWSTGPSNWYSQADKSARAVLWMKALNIPAWEYFIAQGSWGNDGLDFSAIHANDVVKPVMLSLMEAKNQLDHRAVTGWLDTGIPHAYALGFGAKPGDDSQLTALWTDDLSTGVTIAADANTTVTIADEYGATQTVPIVAGTSSIVGISGSVTYVSAPSNAHIVIKPMESFGANIAQKASGATASATSNNPWNSPDGAIDGATDARGQGDFRSSPAWASNVGDPTPTLTVTLASQQVVDRVLMATGGIGSVQPGIRDYDVEVRGADGTWATVDQVRNNFYTRMVLSRFAPVTASAIRIHVLHVNYGGYAGGAMPWFWPTDAASLSDQTQPWYGPAIVRELEVYGPGAVDLAPMAVTATPTSATTATVEWNAPAAVPASYTVMVGDQQLMTTQTSTKVTGLTPRTTYPVVVTATGLAGTSPSATTSMTTPWISQLSIGRGNEVPVSGAPLKIFGQLLRSPGAATAVPSQRIALQVSTNGKSWHDASAATTDSLGRWSTALRPQQSFWMRASYAGSATQESVLTRAWQVPVAWGVSITHVGSLRGGKQAIVGKVTPGASGLFALLAYRDAQGRLHSLKSVRITSQSTFRFVIKRRHVVLHLVVRVPKSTSNAEGTSRVITLRRR
jgi:hypothetical protein